MATNVYVETLIGWPFALLAEMPFAGKKRLVTVRLQLLGNGHLSMRQVIAVARMQQLVGGLIGLAGNPVGNVHSHRMPPRYDTSARRAAHRTRRVALREPHTAGC